MPYENTPQQTTDAAQDRGIESASAGTACQTTTSKFAYILTASVLGGIILIGAAFSALAFGALQSYVAAGGLEHRYEDYSYDYDDYDYDYDFDYDRDSPLTPEQERELEGLVDRLFDEGNLPS
ncbi:MAG: hypothetical protein SOY67_00345 [Collinsella sp.]|nr:hypothetical protein [Collinsella sp.]